MTQIRHCDNTVLRHSLLKPRFMSDILFVSASCLSTQLVWLHSIGVSLPDYCLYAIITVISALFPRSAPPPTPIPHISRSDLWLLILYLSSRRTGAREMTCFCLGWKETHRCSLTRAHARTGASETASTSQCNYRETEQSVTHLSAAGIRAGVLLWHWREKPGVSLLKHNDRQLHLLTWPHWQTKYLDWGARQEDGAQMRNTEVTLRCLAFHTPETAQMFYICVKQSVKQTWSRAFFTHTCPRTSQWLR